jgi:hypothetical protein
MELFSQSHERVWQSTIGEELFDVATGFEDLKNA